MTAPENHRPAWMAFVVSGAIGGSVHRLVLDDPEGGILILLIALLVVVAYR